MTAKQIRAKLNERTEVLENGTLVGWYCHTWNDSGKLVRVFIPV